jgi:hypothetical protein
LGRSQERFECLGIAAALVEGIGGRADAGGGVGIGRERHGSELEDAGLGDRSLRDGVGVVRRLRGRLVPGILLDAEPEGRAVDARLQSGLEVTVVRRVEERHGVGRAYFVFREALDRAQHLIPDRRVLAVVV